MDSAPPITSATELARVVREALREVYAHPIVRDVDDERVAVLGGKAIERARDAAVTAYGAAAAERVVELDVSSLPWFAVPAAGLQLWREHGKRGVDGEMVTELELGDPPVQVVVDIDGWSLIRTYDGAQGWIVQTQLEPTTGAFFTNFTPTGTIEDEVLTFLDVPYVWGGTTSQGVDCSGLVQRAAWRTSKQWLPRHSRALLQVGERVSPSNVSAGDVLVLKRDPRTVEAERAAQLAARQAEQERTGAVGPTGPAVHPMHVAVAVSPTEVVHASRDAMRVVREPLDSLLERYRVLGVRRITTPEVMS
jgi:hypothetical protein